MFYMNTIEQLFLFDEQLDQLEVCLPYSRILTGIQLLAVFQNLRWNSNKTSLHISLPNLLVQSKRFCFCLYVWCCVRQEEKSTESTATNKRKSLMSGDQLQAAKETVTVIMTFDKNWSCWRGEVLVISNLRGLHK